MIEKKYIYKKLKKVENILNIKVQQRDLVKQTKNYFIKVKVVEVMSYFCQSLACQKYL